MSNVIVKFKYQPEGTGICIPLARGFSELQGMLHVASAHVESLKGVSAARRDEAIFGAFIEVAALSNPDVRVTVLDDTKVRRHGDTRPTEIFTVSKADVVEIGVLGEANSALPEKYKKLTGFNQCVQLRKQCHHYIQKERSLAAAIVDAAEAAARETKQEFLQPGSTRANKSSGIGSEYPRRL